MRISFIDSRVQNYQSLISSLEPGTEYHLLDPRSDGLEQIANWLQGRSGIDALHIISHGSQGQLQLGSTQLTSDNLDAYAPQLNQIGAALNDNSDILLYGCEVALGEEGQAFIGQLAQLTGAEVAASTDPTGAAALGGDWELEAATGSIEASALENSDYQGLLGLTVSPNTLSFPWHSSGEFGNYEAFAALRADGSVVTWGYSLHGGDSSAVASQLDGSIDVTQIFSTLAAFAALREDGSVVTWGYWGEGGDSSYVASQLDGSIDVTQIFSTEDAFAALRADGSVVTWGDSRYGGDSSAVASQLNGTIDVTQIFSTKGAFAALRADGSVVTWGNSDYGSDSSAVANQLDGSIDVTQIYSTGSAFAALRADGSVVTWGVPAWGGDSSYVSSQVDGSIDVTQIFSTNEAFAALRADGSVVTWGGAGSGGDSSAVASQLDGSIDVTQIFSAFWAFAALRADGSVVTWGGWWYGGDSSAVAGELDGTTPVTQIFSTDWAFAALRADGSVVTWGDSDYGGDSSAVASQLDGTTPVTQIFSTARAFAALRADGSVVTWGNSDYGGDSSAVASELHDVVYMANPYTNDVYLAGNADTTAPTVTNFSPTDDTTNVAVDSNIVVTFSEPIQRGSGSIVLKNANGTIIETYNAASSSNLSISGNTLTINPSADLASGTGYKVEFAAGSIKDLAGNSYAGTTSYNFTTVAASDTIAPIVSSFSPTDEATGVAIDSNIVVTFSEVIQRGTGSIVLKNANGTVIETYDVATSSNLSISDNTLTINPSADLASGTGYKVEFAAGSIKDLAGNSYAGTTSYNFSTVAPVTQPPTTNASIFMASGNPEVFTLASSGLKLYGGGAREVVSIASDVSAITLDQNIDRFNLPGSSINYTFKQAGNTLAVYDASGNTLLVTATIQGDSDGSQLGFSNGTFDVKLVGATLMIGGAAISSSSPSAVSPITPTSTSEPVPSTLSTAAVYMNREGSFTVSNPGTKIFGSSDDEEVTVSSSATDISFDQNIERVNFSGSSSDYRFKQAGNQVQVYDATGKLLAKGPVQGDADGTILSFANGYGSALLNPTTGEMQLAGSTISASSPSAISTAGLIGGNSTITILGDGTTANTTANETFIIHTGNYTHTINGFNAGDILDFPDTSSPSVENTDFSDGSVDLVYAENGQSLTITITGIPLADDARLNDISGWNSVFGAGTIA